jgi:DNA modification methylase
MPGRWKNKLFCGYNLEVLRESVPDEGVDLVYLDPPFNSKATHNVLFKEKSGEQSAAQIAAFEDTWHWGLEAEATYRDVVKARGEMDRLLEAFRQFLGQNDMMAYLTVMAPRLAELHRVLKPSGSLFLRRGRNNGATGLRGTHLLHTQQNAPVEKVSRRDRRDSHPGLCGRKSSPLGRGIRSVSGTRRRNPKEPLERLILAGSNEGDVVLDPFCGCGTP